jgi:hypothetical protein
LPLPTSLFRDPSRKFKVFVYPLAARTERVTGIAATSPTYTGIPYGRPTGVTPPEASVVALTDQVPSVPLSARFPSTVSWLCPLDSLPNTRNGN